jgi:putative PEP-CTERM system histidine kinase
VNQLIAFWSYAVAACLFASIVFWRLRGRVEGPARLLIGAFFATAVWASVSAIRGPTDVVTVPAETIRNLSWVVLLHAISGDLKHGARRGVRLVFAAVALVIGLQLTLNLLMLAAALPSGLTRDLLSTSQLLRISMASGALVLVHNIYGQAAPRSRIGIRTAMLGLALTWGYDLNLYTLAYLGAPGATGLFEYRGLFMAAIAPLFLIGSTAGNSLRIRLSRAATFQSLSLLAICVYFVVMAILATALRGSQWNWASSVTAGLLATMMIATAVLVLSEWARSWVKVKLAKHLFEHRYDYRTEWLRFTETLGRTGPDAPPLGERIIKAFAEIVDSPGGLLLVSESGAMLERAAEWNWPAGNRPPEQLHASSEFWAAVESRGRILEFEALRHGWGSPKDGPIGAPPWMIEEDRVWVGIPLVHHRRLIGIVILASPDYRRPLDWEDFDLLRTAGGQAASSLAESLSQEALTKAQRFEEFNRRFAFILHDVKNLVSQLSLLSRNAERHADNPDFRQDMVATLKSSVGKMNDLLARLSPLAPARLQRVEAQSLRPILSAAIAGKRHDRDVRLLGDAGLTAHVDSAALEQALGHLLQNALDASPADEPVVVRISGTADAVSIAITDKGCGMDGDFVRNRLFQPFVSTKPDGFGIGSFEARSLVTAMGGRIGVDSRPGRGTTFTILLPAAEPAKGAEPTRKRA